MRVLVFSSLYPNNVWPGHGVFIKERMTRFAKRSGHEVRVVAPVPYHPPLRISSRWRFSQVAREETIEGLPVFHPRYFLIPKIGMSLHGLSMYLSARSLIRRMRRDFDFDLIDAHYVYPDGYAATLLGRYFDRPVVVSARGSDINVFSELPAVRGRVRKALGGARAVIAVSRALERKILELGVPESSVRVISNGVDPEKFHPLPREQARERLGMADKPDRMLIVAVGNLKPVKGLDLLVEAFGAFVRQKKRSDVDLAIVGEGVMRPRLEEQIRDLGLGDRVRLAGGADHESLIDWYNAADLCCLMSEREGFPNVVMESLACGTPVLGARVGGIPEILDSDSFGIVTERRVEAVVDAMDRALATSWDRDAIAATTEPRTWDRVADSLEEVFESVIDAREEPRDILEKSTT